MIRKPCTIQSWKLFVELDSSPNREKRKEEGERRTTHTYKNTENVL